MSASTKTLSLAVAGLAVVLAPVAASASPSVSAVRSIRASAANLASRRRIDRAELGGPARAIALSWTRVAPRFAADPDAFVETKMLNGAIASLESDWSRNVAMAPVDARKVALAAQALLDAVDNRTS